MPSAPASRKFFTVYEKARYANVPAFVTSDSLLHAYHLLFDKVLRTAEVQHFIPLLRDLNAALLARFQALACPLPFRADTRRLAGRSDLCCGQLLTGNEFACPCWKGSEDFLLSLFRCLIPFHAPTPSGYITARCQRLAEAAGQSAARRC